MGFFKRIFSFGRKKKPKQPEASSSANSSVVSQKTQANSNVELEHEAEIGRLLRSSSARYHVVSEMDATSLPPLPHPINDVIPASAASTLSLASTTMNLRGTYNVTVHGRTKQTPCSDPQNGKNMFDDATAAHDNPDYYKKNEKEQSQLLRMRTDPSVASLLDMYDENGHIPSNAFDESPSKEGRSQVRRSGSTLRQLLGNPSTTSLKLCDDGAVSEVESDISWAERFLSEHETGSAESSIQLRTPDTFTSRLPGDTTNDTTYRMEKDMSTVTHPAADSLEVELSLNEDSIISRDTSYSEPAFSQDSEPALRRASQVFAFIHDRRRNKTRDLDDKSMVDAQSIAPTVTLSRSSALERSARTSRHGDSADESIMSTSSGESSMPSTSFANVSTSTTPRRVARYPSSLSRTPRAFPSNRMSTTSDVGEISQDTAILMAEVPRSAPIPTRESKTPPSRIPLAKARRESLPEVGQKRRRVDTMGERSNSVPLEEEERYRSAIPRPRKHRRAASQGPTASYETSEFREAKRQRRSTGGSCVLGAARVADWKMDQDSSNDFVQVDWIDSPVKFSKPSSPVRAKSESRILSRLDTRSDLLGIPPDEGRLNSSSELSPVGRQMMFKARQQRRRTTDPHSQTDRPERGKFGFRG